MLIILLEIAVALALLLLIVWATWPKKKSQNEKSRNVERKDEDEPR